MLGIVLPDPLVHGEDPEGAVKPRDLVVRQGGPDPTIQQPPMVDGRLVDAERGKHLTERRLRFSLLADDLPKLDGFIEGSVSIAAE